MEERIINSKKKLPRILYRKTRKLGNSAGVLLPKALLDCYVKILVVRPPINIKKDVITLLNQNLEDILGIYILPAKHLVSLNKESFPQKRINDSLGNHFDNKKINFTDEMRTVEKLPKKIEILAVSNDTRNTINSSNYKIDIVPILTLKKSVRENKELRQKIKLAKVIINNKLLEELRK